MVVYGPDVNDPNVDSTPGYVTVGVCLRKLTADARNHSCMSQAFVHAWPYMLMRERKGEAMHDLQPLVTTAPHAWCHTGDYSSFMYEYDNMASKTLHETCIDIFEDFRRRGWIVN